MVEVMLTKLGKDIGKNANETNKTTASVRRTKPSSNSKKTKKMWQSTYWKSVNKKTTHA